MNNWKKYKFSELCTKIGSGATPRGGDSSYKSEGISLIRSQNILDFVFSEDGLAFIDEKQAKDLANVEIKERDVLINITGDSVARVCQVPIEILPARVNQHVAILRADQKNLNPEYLKYYLLAKPVKELLLTFASTGATRKALTKGMIEEFEISIPDLPTQTRIASILSSLDDKIELNRRMNHTLEQMAQALFNHYFVDNIDVDNLPGNWRNVKLKDCLKLLKDGSHNPPKRTENGIKFIAGATNIKDLIIDFSKSTFISKEEYNKIHKNWEVSVSDVLLTIVGTIGNVALVRERDLPFSLQRSIAILRPNELICKSYLYLLLKSKAFSSYINSHSNRTAQPGIYLGNLSAFPISLAPKNIISQFDREASLIIEKMLLNASEIETLSTIRDTLLPKLMSGKIDVSKLLEAELTG